MKRISIIFSLFILFIWSVSAQSPAKYWVEFTDKKGSEYSVDRPEEFLSPRAIQNRATYKIAVTEEDLPVNRHYIETLLDLDTGMILFTRSRWLNGVTVYCEKEDILGMIEGLPFVKRCEKTILMKEPEYRVRNGYYFMNSLEPKFIQPLPFTDSDYGKAESQVRLNNIHWLHRMGYKGEGIPMMVMDGGFFNVDTLRYFSELRADNRLRGIRNFVEPGVSVFRKENHGTMVLSCIASDIPGELVGTAPHVMVYLAKTEDGRSETKVEEDNWVAGIEWADSLGCLVLNSSLGYTKFDDTVAQPRHYRDLNGKTSRASIAASMASARGMIVCNSAGNEGRGKWKHIGSPADAKDILAVGAVDISGKKADFSSFGPTADGRVKPDACAVGKDTYVGSQRSITLRANGTSFASPLLAGMVACLRQAFPERSNYDIMNAVRMSGSQALQPDSALGYGITDFMKAYNLLLQPVDEKGFSVEFDTYATDKEHILLTVKSDRPQEIRITLTARRQGIIAERNHTLTSGTQEIELEIPKLKKKIPYDIWDVKITGTYTGERAFVIGAEQPSDSSKENKRKKK